ncbi:hypothetical protein [Streptomyces sp. NRRL F-4489]|uniref:hypothetical protein n=1 Tax=Streptomyces sp. NRRL F-4489 TaxID=1609095 RepID=UPI000AB11005|nr:hypothetical protein [Streptomyces sp. NRRL F-4489]
MSKIMEDNRFSPSSKAVKGSVMNALLLDAEGEVPNPSIEAHNVHDRLLHSDVPGWFSISRRRDSPNL